MKKLALMLAFFVVGFSTMPVVNVNAATPSASYSASSEVTYDAEGNAYVTISSEYENNSSRRVFARVNYRFLNIGAQNIKESTGEQRKECLEIERPEGLRVTVRMVCNKFRFDRPMIIEPKTSGSFEHTFKINKNFVDKDKNLKFEVVFKDGIWTNEDPFVALSVKLDNISNEISHPTDNDTTELSASAFAAQHISMVLTAMQRVK